MKIEIDITVASDFMEARKRANDATTELRKARRAFDLAVGDGTEITVAGETIAVVETTKVRDLKALQAAAGPEAVKACMMGGTKLAVESGALEIVRILAD